MDVDIPRVAGIAGRAGRRRDRAGAGAHRPTPSRARRSSGCGSTAAPYFLKVLSAEADWIMRVTGNTTHWEWQVWQAGLYDDVPAEIDHAMVAMALDRTGPAPRLAMLMTDCADDLVPPGDAVLPADQHAPLHRAPGRHARREARLDRHHRPPAAGAAVPVLRARRPSPPSSTSPTCRGRSGSPTRAGRCCRSRAPDLDALVRGGARRPARARRRAAGDPADVRGRRLEAGQPRLPARRPHDRARLGLPRRGAAVLGARVVPRPQPQPSPRDQGGDHRALPASRSSDAGSRPGTGGTASSGCACSG